MTIEHSRLANPVPVAATSCFPSNAFASIARALMYNKLYYFFSCCAALAVSFCSCSIDFSEWAWSPRSALTCIIETTLARILSLWVPLRAEPLSSTGSDRKPSQTYRALAVASETLVPFSLALLLLLQLLLLERLGLFGAAVVCADISRQTRFELILRASVQFDVLSSLSLLTERGALA
jgi:hypothetical protein